jgi:hypothetical protein
MKSKYSARALAIVLFPVEEYPSIAIVIILAKDKKL